MRVNWLLALLLAGCTLGGGKLATPGTGAGPIKDDAIEVTALDAAPAVKPGPGDAAGAVSADPVKADPAKPSAAKPEADKPEPVKPLGETADPSAVPAVTPTPAPVLSPEALACQKTGGTWSVAGKAGGMACVRMLRDGGKSCRKQSDCEGSCLARSNTCAPIAPLFGCNEIVQDNGVVVTLCID